MSPQLQVTIVLLLGVNAILLAAIHRQLTRIARGDFLRAPINSYGEGIGDAIQGQMIRGQAGISQYDR